MDKNKNMANYLYVNDVLDFLRDIIDDNTIHSMVGGSYALKYCYEVIDREPDDIDIILAAPNSARITGKNSQEILKRLQKAVGLFGDEVKPAFTAYEAGEDKDSVMKDNYLNHYFYMNVRGKETKINILMPKEYNKRMYTSEMRYRDIRIATLEGILGAKRSYGREKDKKDLENISFRIITGDPADEEPEALVVPKRVSFL